MALLLAVLIGVVLIGAASALLAVQLLTRRSGTSATNRDLAEAAAMSGLNRIETLLNQPANRQLWELPSTAWIEAGSAEGRNAIRPLASQPCSITAIDSNTLALLRGGSIGGERNDAGGTIASRYALRSYSKSGTDWVLTVEGITARDAGQGVVMARSLISRRFEVSPLGVSRIGGWNDWAVLAGRQMELGSTQVLNNSGNGPGVGLVQLVLEDTSANRNSFLASGSCDSSALMARVGATSANLQDRIWPTLGQTMPGAGWFDAPDKTVIDKVSTTGAERVWQCDDRYTPPCNFSDVTNSSTTIRMQQSKICTGNTTNRPCQVWIQKIRLRSKTLLIETPARPVILKLSGYSSVIDLAESGRICIVQTVGGSACSQSTPERLVILGSAADTATGCNDSTTLDQSYVSIAGDSLPGALVVLPEATFRLSGPATMRGLVWARRICASPGLNLLSQANSQAVIQRASGTWAIPTTATAGRTLLKVRSTSTDPFQPWP